MNTLIRIKVRRGPLSGLLADGKRFSIEPGIYDVMHENNKLTFYLADKRNGGNIVVDIDDYSEWGEFPNVGPHQTIEVLPSQA